MQLNDIALTQDLEQMLSINTGMQSLHQLPLTFEEVGHKPASYLIMHALLSDLANKFVSGANKPVQFGLVRTDEEWESVRKIRLKIYNEGSSYLKTLVNDSGQDAYDANSFVFYAYYDGRIMGTIRLNRFPYETFNFLAVDVLSEFLGPGWKDEYLEISRLAVDSSCSLQGVSNALVIYASLITACFTQYKFYFAYSHPKLRDRVFKFKQYKEMLNFKIPGRRSSNYVLFKGVFWEDFADLIEHHGMDLVGCLQRELHQAGMVE